MGWLVIITQGKLWLLLLCAVNWRLCRNARKGKHFGASVIEQIRLTFIRNDCYCDNNGTDGLAYRVRNVFITFHIPVCHCSSFYLCS